MEERISQIRDKFNSRPDKELWGLRLNSNGEKIGITMRAENSKKRPVELFKEIKIDEEDYIDKVFTEF